MTVTLTLLCRKSDLRYEGRLHSVDQEQGSVRLSSVQCFGGMSPPEMKDTKEGGHAEGAEWEGVGQEGRSGGGWMSALDF